MVCDRDCFHCKFKDCILDEKADVNEQKKEWIHNNPEKRKAIRQRYYTSHAEQEKAYQRALYQKIKDTPEYKARKRLRNKEYKERKKVELNGKENIAV